MNKKIIQEQFGAEAAAYVSSKTHAKGASLLKLIELLDPRPDWQVLDIATGAGHTAFALSPYVQRVRATDITAEMLQHAEILAQNKGLQNITIEYADAENLPYENDTFDLVTCRIAPHHFSNINRFVEESVRVLKTEGFFAVVDNVVPRGSVGNYVNAFEKFRDPSHFRCLSMEEWEMTFNDHGLSIKFSEKLAKRLEFSFWAKRHDPVYQSYLQAMLFELSPEAKKFLQPKFNKDGLSFRLVEGIIIGQKNL